MTATSASSPGSITLSGLQPNDQIDITINNGITGPFEIKITCSYDTPSLSPTMATPSPSNYPSIAPTTNSPTADNPTTSSPMTVDPTTSIPGTDAPSTPATTQPNPFQPFGCGSIITGEYDGEDVVIKGVNFDHNGDNMFIRVRIDVGNGYKTLCYKQWQTIIKDYQQHPLCLDR